MKPQMRSASVSWIRRCVVVVAGLALLQTVACACATCPAKHAPEMRVTRR